MAIADSLFKELSHSYQGYEEFSNGSGIMEGYKPDYVLKEGNRYVILESENNTNRKMFVGCLMKAAYFLRGENTGFLVTVLHEHDNTTLEQIWKHLVPYFQWIKKGGLTNMEKVYLIKDEDYQVEGKTCHPIDSEAFLSKAKVIDEGTNLNNL